MKNSNNSTTNKEIASSLVQLKKGQSANSNLLVFDPSTGEFVVTTLNQQIGADATTINSIARDGFANL